MLLSHLNIKGIGWNEENRNQIPKKLRLPDSTTTFVRDKSGNPPFGRFTRFSWALTSIFHVKRVFDVEGLIQLDVTREFVRSKKVRKLNSSNLVF